MDIMETIRARYSEISSVQKRIADYCLEHPDAASFQTLREFAQTTHTTDATVLKFCSNIWVVRVFWLSAASFRSTCAYA